MALPTQEDVQELTSSMKDFTKMIEKSNAAWLVGRNTASEINEAQEQILDNLERQQKVAKNNLGVFSDMKEIAKDLVDDLSKFTSLLSAGGIIAFTTKVLKNTADLDNKMTKLAHNMGKMVSKEQLTGAVSKLQKELGAAYDDAASIITVLSEKRFTDNIYDAAAGVELFSRATGLSNVTVADLTDTLSKGAGMSVDSINAMYASMMNVQAEIGLSKQGMEAAANQIAITASKMAAFGKSSDQIKKMATHTTALVASLEKVGISADRASSLIGSLTDPDRIEDNILLYSQLGITMEEALSGDISFDALGGQLQDLAQKIVDMGPIAGSQFAKSMGLSYSEAAKIASGEMDSAALVGEQALTAEEQALETMKKLEEQTQGFTEKVGRSFNKIEGFIRGLPVLLIGGLGVAAAFIKKKINSLKEGKQFSLITEGIGSAVANGIKKGLDEGVAKITSAGQAFKRGIGAWFDRSSFGGFFNGIETRMDAVYAKAKKEDPFLTYWKSSVENLQSAEDAFYEGKLAEITKIKQQVQNLGGKFDEKNKDSVEFEIDESKLTKHERNSISLARKRLEVLEAEAGKYIEINSLKEKISDLEEIASKANAHEAKAEDLNKQIESLQEQKKLGEKSKTLSKEARKELDKKISLLNAEHLYQKGLAETEKEKLKISEEQIAKLKEQGIENGNLLDQRKEELRIAEEAIKIKQKEPKSGVSALIKGSVNKLKTAYKESDFGKRQQEIMNNRAATGKKGGAGVAFGLTALESGLKGIGKGIGGLMKVMGPMAIVSTLIGKVVEKVQSKLEKAFDIIGTSLEPSLDIVGELAVTLIKSIMPSILRILATGVQILGWILKPIIGILKAVSKLPFLGSLGDALGSIADTMEAVTSDTMVDALKNAADSIEQSSLNIEESTEEAATEDKPAIVNSVGGDLVQSSEATTNSVVNNQAASTTVTTNESSSDSQIKEMEKNKDKKEQVKRENEMLELLLKKLDTIVTAINNLGAKENSGSAFGATSDNIEATF